MHTRAPQDAFRSAIIAGTCLPCVENGLRCGRLLGSLTILLLLLPKSKVHFSYSALAYGEHTCCLSHALADGAMPPQAGSQVSGQVAEGPSVEPLLALAELAFPGNEPFTILKRLMCQVCAWEL